MLYDRLRVQFPGNHGGVNWGGGAFDPSLGYLFLNTNELGQLQGYKDRTPAADGAPASGIGGGRASGRGDAQAAWEGRWPRSRRPSARRRSS